MREVASFDRPDTSRTGPILSQAQGAAAEALRQAVAAQAFSVTVLDGVTGSGKTEVYFEAISAALDQGHQVLVMLPEIALSAQWLARFRARFGVPTPPSGIPSSARASGARPGAPSPRAGRRWWSARGLRCGCPSAPSASSWSTRSTTPPSSRRTASSITPATWRWCARASRAAPIVLVSATPSLETVVNVENGRYRCERLPDRHGGAQLPAIETVDLRETPPARGTWLAPALRTALAETLDAGEQALLFLNRRGYAPLTLCRACGHRFHCPNCSAWLVEHRFAGTLDCHHCGFQRAQPEACPACEAEGSFAACGPGVERLAEEVDEAFPGARWAVLTSDTVRGPSQVQDLVDAIVAHEVDVLIGTQMVAKGHHFPQLTLVGVVDADLGLAGGDMRAAERTYQLLHQVGGRAGRGGRPGRVVLQTYAAEHPVIAALAGGDRDSFMENAGGSGPRGARPAALRPTRGGHRVRPERVRHSTRGVSPRAYRAGRRKDPSASRCWVPPRRPSSCCAAATAFAFSSRHARGTLIQPHMRRWLAALDRRTRTRLQVDIDPHSFM